MGALLFTTLSFWWMNWRPGKLQVGSTPTYMAAGSLESKLILGLLPLFYNSGALPAVVHNLRLVFLDADDQGTPVKFMATLNKLNSAKARSTVSCRRPGSVAVDI